MHRFRNILAVELDAPLPRAVVGRAADLARRNDGTLTLLGIEEEMPVYLRRLLGEDRANLLETATLEERRERLRELASSVAGSDLRCRTGAASGRPFLEVIRQVLRGGHDLVVVTAGTGRPWFGSAVTHLLRKCPVPVWVLRDRDAADRRVLVPVDLDAGEADEPSPLAVRLLEIGSSLARLQGAELHVASVWTVYGEALLRRRGSVEELREAVERADAENRRRMDRLLASVPLDGIVVRTHLLRGRPADRIAELARTHDVDVLVLGTVGRSGLRGLLIGNTAEDVLARVSRPVLAVKPVGFTTPVPSDGGEPPPLEWVAASAPTPVLAGPGGGAP